MKPANRHRGYVLLITLMLLAVAAAAAAGLARKALEATLDVHQKADELQQRWGTLSCRAVFLPRAEDLLKEAEEKSSAPTGKTNHRLLLNGMPLDLVFTDEQAKVNIRALATTPPASEDLRRLVRLSTSDSQRWLDIAERRMAAATDTAGEVGWRSYGALFADVAPSRLMGDGETEGVADSVTCWGDGRLNVWRSSEQAIRIVCAPHLGPLDIERLLEARERRGPDLSLSRLLDPLALREEDRQVVAARLSDGSRCHGLWIVCRTPRRSWYTFAVADDSAGRGDERRQLIFSW